MAVNWLHYPEVSSSSRDQVEACLEEYLQQCFNPKRKRMHTATKKRRREALTSKYISKFLELGGEPLHAHEALTFFLQHNDDDAVPWALATRFPYSQMLVSGWKVGELRDIAPPANRLHKSFFIYESRGTGAYAVHDGAVHPVQRKPMRLVGTVRLRTSQELTAADLHDRLAEATGLTLPALEQAFNDGYKHVWWVDSPIQFKYPPLFVPMKVEIGWSPKWNKVTQAPHPKKIKTKHA
jgi:hypothetical protein